MIQHSVPHIVTLNTRHLAMQLFICTGSTCSCKLGALQSALTACCSSAFMQPCMNLLAKVP